MNPHNKAEFKEDVKELVGRAQKGHSASYTVLYELFSEKIFRYVAFKTGNQEDAADITGDVFLKMLESINSFKWQGYPFSSWLFRIAHNLIVDYFRKKTRRKTVPLEVASSLAATPIDLDRRIDHDLQMEAVQVAMRNLTNLQQEVISLRFAAGLSVAETAKTIGKKVNAVKALQHAGLKKLRRPMVPEPMDPIVVTRVEL